jgi:hypothetical protein
MNRAQLTRFATRSAAQRVALFGVEWLLGTQRFTASLNAATTTRQLEAGGWNEEVSATLRVSRAEITRAGLAFALGDQLTQGTSATYRIAEIRDNPVSPELVLGLARDLSRA